MKERHNCICLNCKIKFSLPLSRKGKEGKYCSKKCQFNFVRKSNNIYFENYFLIKNNKILFDEEDKQKIKKHIWRIDNKGKGRKYIRSNTAGHLHRYILNANCNRMIDHKNNNTFDNRKQNLRFVTNSQNMLNRKKVSVSYRTDTRKWKADTMVNGKVFRLGYYNTEEEALQVKNDFLIRRGIK